MTFRTTIMVLGAMTLASASASIGAAQDTTTSGVRIGLTYSPGTRPGVLVVPVTGPNADSVRAILARDLDYGDRVTAIDGGSGDAPSGTLNYALYAKLGAAALVQASVTPAGSLHIALHDVGAGKVMNVGDFVLPQPALGAAWRLAVHGASDEIERWITGQRGINQTRVLFVRDQRLWTVDVDGAGLNAVPGVGSALSPTWHPSGRYIAYMDLSNDGTHVSVRDLVSGSSRRIPDRGGSNITPAFSPDGSTLVFASGNDGMDLFAVPAFENETPRRITNGRGSSNSNPSFSPDGRSIAFTSGRLGHPEVYITDADGTNPDLLTSTGFGDQLYRANPDWSPDGRRVAFQSQIAGVFQIMTINLRDRSVQALTSEGRNEDPSWAPDGRHIVFTSSRSGAKQLWILDTETFRIRQVKTGGASRQAAWSPRLDNAK
jgi:TolB protein